MDTKKLRQKILDLAIHGKLVPQDPNDEPASVLLERIRAEKERLIAEGKIKRSKKSDTSDTSHYENVPFEVPEGWCWCRLDKLCDIKGGKRVPRGMSFSDVPTSHVYIRVTNMKKNTIIDNELKYIDDEVFSYISNYTISKSDLYLTIAGTIGDVGEVPDKYDMMNLTENAAKLTNIICDRKYLMYSLLSSQAQEHFSSKFHQVAQPKLSIETASSTFIPIPPMEEQKRIVAKIEELLTIIDLLDDSKLDLEQHIIQAKSKILDLAIHGKLVPQDTSDEPASELLKRINPKADASCDNPHYEQMPQGWCVTNIGDLLTNRDSERVPLSLGVRCKQKNKIYDYYGATGVVDKVDGYLFNERLLLIGEDGANLLSRNKDNAFFAEGKYWVNNHAHILDCSEKSVLDYVAIVINSMSLEAYITGSAQPKLNQDNLKKIEILLPPLPEQRRIIERINTLYQQLDAISSALD